MESIDNQLMSHCRCDQCTLSSVGMKKCVFPRVEPRSEKVSALIIGDFPRLEDIRPQTLQSSYSGKVLRATLEALGISLDSIRFTNAALCQTPNEREVLPNELANCNARLVAEIEQYQPLMILAMGNTALKALGIDVSVMSVHGQWFKFKGYDVLATYSPQFIVNQPDLFRDWQMDLAKCNGFKDRFWKEDDKGWPVVPYEVGDQHQSELFLLKMENARILFPSWYTIDIETSTKYPWMPNSRIISLGIKPSFSDKTWIFPWECIEKQLSRWQYFLSTFDIGGANLAFEYMWLKAKGGIELNCQWDSMLMHHQLDSRSGDDDGGKAGSYHGLKTLGKVYCNVGDWGKAMDPYRAAGYDTAPKDLLYHYQAIDVAVTDQIIHILKVEMKGQNKLGPESRYEKIIVPAIKLVSNFESRGCLVDIPYLKRLERIGRKKITKMKKQFGIDVGVPGINLQSPKQIAHLLFTTWKLPRIQKDCTDKHVIKKLCAKFPNNVHLQKIADIRSFNTILSTFIVGLIKDAEKNGDGKVHSRFLLHGTPTGRLASRSPNLQNIPARIGSIIRNAFIPPDDWDMVNIDYKQLEFRLLGWYSMDKAMIKLFFDDRDIHDEVARAFFNVPPEREPTKNQRLDAKTFVFRIPYGGGPEGVAADFGLPLVEARRRHQAIKTTYPDAMKWIDATQDSVAGSADSKIKGCGYVTSMTGMTRHFDLITKRNIKEVRRESGNSPIQGGASDICLMAAMKVEAYMEKHYPNDWMGLFLVHDSYVAICRRSMTQTLLPIAGDIMEVDPFPTPIKFKVDTEYGPRWGEDSLIKLKRP